MIRGLILISPGRCCWSCERVLPPTPRAVSLTASSTPKGWALYFVCGQPGCSQEVLRELEGIGLEGLGLETSILRYIEALVMIHGADEVEIVEGWERATLNRKRDIKIDVGIRAITEALGADRPWLVSRTGAAAWEKLVSLGMGTSSRGAA